MFGIAVANRTRAARSKARPYGSRFLRLHGECFHRRLGMSASEIECRRLPAALRGYAQGALAFNLRRDLTEAYSTLETIVHSTRIPSRIAKATVKTVALLPNVTTHVTIRLAT